MTSIKRLRVRYRVCAVSTGSVDRKTLYRRLKIRMEYTKAVTVATSKRV